MVEFKDSDDLRKWLVGKSVEFSQVIATRIALRTLPTTGQIYPFNKIDDKTRDKLTSSIFRACLILWVARKFPVHDINIYATNANNATNAAANAAHTDFAAIFVTGAAIAAIAADADFAIVYTSDAAALAAHAVVRATVDIDYAVAIDATLLKEDISPQKLAEQPLWHKEMPEELKKEWQSLKKVLLAQSQNWQVWVDWYGDILAGRKPAGLPDDIAEDLYIKIATQGDYFWKQDVALVNEDITKWTDAAKKEADERGANENNISKIAEPELQNAGAIRFTSENDEPIGIYHSPDNILLGDKGAIDRHSEVKRLAIALISSYDPSELGANSVTQLIDDVRNYQISLGENPEQANIDLLIPRGDGLRMAFEAQKNIDDLSDLPPISDKYKLALEYLIKAHNVYVALDPALAKRDEALLGPDAKKNLISPADGMELIKDAVEAGVAKPEVAEALGEEAKVAPENPDAENRKSRRSSEGFKNFGRIVINILTVMSVPTSIGVVSYGLGKWFLANEVWFLNTFSYNPTMIEVITKVIETLNKLPLNLI